MFFLYISKGKSGISGEEIGKTIPVHIEWVKSKTKEGNLVQAGKWGEVGGAGIIKAESLDQARELLMSDPLIEKGLVTFEMHVFYPDVPLE